MNWSEIEDGKCSTLMFIMIFSEEKVLIQPITHPLYNASSPLFTRSLFHSPSSKGGLKQDTDTQKPNPQPSDPNYFFEIGVILLFLPYQVREHTCCEDALYFFSSPLNAVTDNINTSGELSRVHEDLPPAEVCWEM